MFLKKETFIDFLSPKGISVYFTMLDAILNKLLSDGLKPGSDMENKVTFIYK